MMDLGKLTVKIDADWSEVKAAIQEAVEAERARCLEIAWTSFGETADVSFREGYNTAAFEIYHAIASGLNDEDPNAWTYRHEDGPEPPGAKQP